MQTKNSLLNYLLYIKPFAISPGDTRNQRFIFVALYNYKTTHSSGIMSFAQFHLFLGAITIFCGF